MTGRHARSVQPERAGDDPLVPLVLLADVEEKRARLGVEQLARLGGVDLVDLGLDLLEQLIPVLFKILFDLLQILPIIGQIREIVFRKPFLFQALIMICQIVAQCFNHEPNGLW